MAPWGATFGFGPSASPLGELSQLVVLVDICDGDTDGVVVSGFAPVDRRRFGHPASRSGRLQDAERYRGSAHVLPTPRCRGNTLAHAGPAAQEVSGRVSTSKFAV